MELLKAILILVIGFVLLIKGADFLSKEVLLSLRNSMFLPCSSV